MQRKSELENQYIWQGMKVGTYVGVVVGPWIGGLSEVYYREASFHQVRGKLLWLTLSAMIVAANVGGACGQFYHTMSVTFVNKLQAECHIIRENFKNSNKSWRDPEVRYGMLAGGGAGAAIGAHLGGMMEFFANEGLFKSRGNNYLSRLGVGGLAVGLVMGGAFGKYGSFFSRQARSPSHGPSTENIVSKKI